MRAWTHGEIATDEDIFAVPQPHVPVESHVAVAARIERDFLLTGVYRDVGTSRVRHEWRVRPFQRVVLFERIGPHAGLLDAGDFGETAIGTKRQRLERRGPLPGLGLPRGRNGPHATVHLDIG